MSKKSEFKLSYSWCARQFSAISRSKFRKKGALVGIFACFSAQFFLWINLLDLFCAWIMRFLLVNETDFFLQGYSVYCYYLLAKPFSLKYIQKNVYRIKKTSFFFVKRFNLTLIG